MKFAIVSQAKDPAVSYSLLVGIGTSLVKQAATDFASFWETLPCEVDVFLTAAAVPEDRCLMLIVDDIPEAPNALAYHSITPAGRPMLRLGWETIKANGGTLIKGGGSMSSAMSHEVLETIGDPYVGWWSDFDGTREIALEVCDPVQGDSYEIDGIAVSNFVGPRYFSQGPGPYDYMGSLTAPLTLSPGGYIVLREDGPAGKQTQQFGRNVTLEQQILRASYGRRGSVTKK